MKQEPDEDKKLILKGCWGKHKAMQNLFAIPHELPMSWTVPTVRCLCVFVFTNSGLAVQILEKNKNFSYISEVWYFMTSLLP